MRIRRGWRRPVWSFWDCEMRRIALIPMKNLELGKTRLSKVLSPTKRRRIVLSMLSNVIKACKGAGLECVVLSSDRRVLAICRRRKCKTMIERAESLNESVEEAVRQLGPDAETRISIVFSDLPLLSSSDISTIMRVLDHCDVVISPDLHLLGTNIIALKGVFDGLRFMYGRESFNAHLHAFNSRGKTIKTYISLGTALDIDTPGDIHLLEKILGKSRAWSLLSAY
ncbi:MAG: 2-phospho-L-lactate guanylyltransferase [Aigarchaeota archaeon]|nr:2-phospho-L-lactate guanylyltransferase [Candidatus Pelearchaeum maunauluense]